MTFDFEKIISERTKWYDENGTYPKKINWIESVVLPSKPVHRFEWKKQHFLISGLFCFRITLIKIDNGGLWERMINTSDERYGKRYHTIVQSFCNDYPKTVEFWHEYLKDPLKDLSIFENKGYLNKRYSNHGIIYKQEYKLITESNIHVMFGEEQESNSFIEKFKELIKKDHKKTFMFEEELSYKLEQQQN